MDTVKSGWSIVYIEGVTGNTFQNIVFHSLKNDFVLANSVDPDEMSHYAAFHLGFQCLLKYPFRGFYSSKVNGNGRHKFNIGYVEENIKFYYC